MDLRFTKDEEDFRTMVRAWFQENVPASLRKKVVEGLRLSKDDTVAWQHRLNARGWLAPHWPVEYGGTGWTPIQAHIFEEEMAMAGAPPPLPFGVSMVGPVIYTFGSDEQKKHYLPRILSSEDWWCQGFSEPGSGSDLASLRTKAVLDGDHWVVNGQKTWTTLAQHADMIFCLVRTEPEAKAQSGISFLLIDMKTPGITVRPIITIDGEHEVNEVFFDDVRVPAANLVGERGKGWSYAKFLLGNERTGIAGVGRSKRQLQRLRRIASAEHVDGRPLIQDPLFRRKIAEVEVELAALEMTVLRVAANATAGHGPGPEASILKIKGTEIQQAITELLVEAVGPYALPFQPDAMEEGWNGEPVGPEHAAPVAPTYFNWRKVSIYGGSNEIQRNILAKAVLGL
ncbi:MAG TPA: acyl-CoA dehydrogenase family protein [Azospirillaceae bacterium]|nr:acyl-CoA dehydrogenase family protein [Azospirillaceae bacterium]